MKEATRTRLKIMASGVRAPAVDGEFAVVIDTREQKPFAYAVTVPLVVMALPAGDYSARGYETDIAIERKSIDDFAGSVGRDRDRFFRELEKLAQYKYAAVIIEASHADVLRHRYRSIVEPACVLGTAAKISAELKIPVFFCGDAYHAADWCLRLLRHWHKTVKQAEHAADVAALERDLLAGGTK